MTKTPNKTRGPAKLASLTYEQIAKDSGYTLRTVRSYATQDVFNARDLHACLTWINEQRQRRGWDMIGIPETSPEVTALDSTEIETADVTPLPVIDCGCNSH